MELELGLKITKARNDLTADLRIIKNGGGLAFLSRETEAMFILTAHLQGYMSENIDIKINKDGTHISIMGRKAVQEKVIWGCVIQSNEVELRGFDKVFRIPEGVVLDRIKAKFNEEESVLTISMPKSVKGISGSVVEETIEKSEVSASSEKTDETKQDTEETEQVQGGTMESEDQSGRREKCRVNVPAVAGSALLVSVLVLVINLVRTRQK